MPGFNDLNLMTHYGVSMSLPNVGDSVELQPLNPQKPDNEKAARAESDPTVKLMLSKKLGELMQTMSGSMHGQLELVTRFENELKDFTDRANALEAKTGKVSDEEITALADAGNALAAELEKSRSSFPDEKLHAQLVLTLRSVRAHVDNLLQTAVATARLNARNLLPQKPLDNFFGPTPLVPDFATKMPTIAKLHQTHQAFAEALENFLSTPTKGNASKMKTAAKALLTLAEKLPSQTNTVSAEARAVMGHINRLSSDFRLKDSDRTFITATFIYANNPAHVRNSNALESLLNIFGINKNFADWVDSLAAHTGTLKTNLSRDDLSGDGEG